MSNIQEIKKLEVGLSKQVNTLIEQRGINIPKGYDAQKSIINAMLVIKQEPKLLKCTQESLGQSLLNMVTMGLDISNKQAYLIPYGNTAQLSISYFGQQTALRRINGVIDIVAQAIYDGDDVDYDVDNGNITNFNHKTKFGNRNKEVVGAYAIISLDESIFGRDKHIEVMTKEEIDKAWGQGSMKGNSPAHKNFPQEMSKKTVINRAIKNFANTITDDPNLVKAFNETIDKEYQSVKYNANQEVIEQDFTKDETPIKAEFEEKTFTDEELNEKMDNLDMGEFNLGEEE